MGRTGRPSKLTPETQAEICRAIRIGATREVAAQAVGIARRTLQYWIERGKAEQERLAQKGARKRKREQPYLHFLHALEEAEAEGEVTHLEAIAADGAAGSKWILARRHSERWAEVRKQQHSGPEGKPIPFDMEAWKREREERAQEWDGIEDGECAGEDA